MIWPCAIVTPEKDWISRFNGSLETKKEKDNTVFMFLLNSFQKETNKTSDKRTEKKKKIFHVEFNI